MSTRAGDATRRRGRGGRSRSWAGRLRRLLPSGVPSGRGLVATVAVIAMLVVGGGVPGVIVTALIGVIGLALLAALPNLATALGAQPATFRIGLLMTALLPLLQIVPLPPSIWHALPGQELRVDTLALAGLADSWQPLSVTPLFTAGSAVIATAFVALVVLLLDLPEATFRRVGWAIMAIVAVNLLLGLVQVASDGQALAMPDSDHGFFTGFYANKNHAALVLASSVPIMAYLLGSRHETRGTRAALGLYAGLIAVALVTTNSRSGIVLGLVALALTASLYVRSIRPIHLLALGGVVVIGVALVSATSAFETVFSRFAIVDQDLRWQFLQTSRWLIDQFWLFGSGIGSFSTIYAVGEPLAVVRPTYVNQLHDEYPQLLIEAGVMGAATLLLFVAGIAWRAVDILRGGDRGLRLAVICGGLVLLLTALHSGVDYPLRRPAVLPIFAFAIALCVRGDLKAVTGIRPWRKQRA